MSFGQNIRAVQTKFTNLFRPKPKADPFATPAPETQAAPPEPEKKRGVKSLILLLLLVLVPAYYVVGALLTHRINDDLNFKVTAPAPGKSTTVEVMAALIDREVNQTKWAPNIQGFEPAALLRIGGNMVNFQSGLMRSLANVTFEMESRLARVRGTSAEDKDMAAARQGLSRSVDTWLLAGADSEYRKAREALLRYDNRLASGQAVFEIRADNLQGLLDRIALDLGGMTDTIDQQILARRHVIIDTKADKVFYFAKGQAYAYFIILRAIREDYKSVLIERHVDKIYDGMLTDLAMAAQLQPMIVQNGNPDGAFLPNHLSAEGFYILRSRAKLREITDILQR